MTKPREVLCRTALTKTGIPGYDYCLNPYIGCMHNCGYCYASFMKRFTCHQEPWGSFVDIKVNLPEMLEKQLKKKKPPQGRVIVGTVTDAYQPVEARYCITRRSLEIMTRQPFLEISVLTKSSLVVRDIDLLRALPGCSVGFSFTTLDEKTGRLFEPGASPSGLRLAAARQLAQEGMPVWIFIAPLLPGITDQPGSLKHMLTQFKEAGIESVLVDLFNPYAAALHQIKAIYQRRFPTARVHLDTYLRNSDLYRQQVWDELKRCHRETGIHAELL